MQKVDQIESLLQFFKWRPQADYKRGTRVYDDLFIGVERIHEYVLSR